MIRRVGIVAFTIAILTIFLPFLSQIIGEQNLLTAAPIKSGLKPSLNLVYPDNGAKTKSDRIFFIGNAPPQGTVLLNGRPIMRSKSGNFAPSLPLQLGENQITLAYKGEGKNEQLQLKIKRLAIAPTAPEFGFISDSLYPGVSIVRPVSENICFKAIATPKSEVSVKVGESIIALTEVENSFQLPENSAVLTGKNEPFLLNSLANRQEESLGNYEGCTSFSQPLISTPVIYSISKSAKVIGQNPKAQDNLTQVAVGKVEILPTETKQVAEVIVDAAIARTGAGSDFSRLTPLPKGTQASVTAKEGDWLRLDYGGWVETKSVKLKNSYQLPRSLVRSISTRLVKDLDQTPSQNPGQTPSQNQAANWTEVIIPLQIPVPISISQSDRLFRLTLHNVTAQTDTILANADPIIQRLDWQQINPGQVQYDILLKSNQQWGYKVRYQGTSLVLSLRHPPQIVKNGSQKENLKNLSILLDPGHGSSADLGSRGGTGYPEKDVTLIIAKLLRSELQKYGAKVELTRTGDQDILPGVRAEMIERQQPTLALSLHYNALPDRGDAEHTAGISMFWYHSQSQSLAQFLHDDLTAKLGRKSYGVFWNNLAVARPTVSPAILLELGFMTHPDEFEWITDPIAQKKLAKTLGEAIYTWLNNSATVSQAS
jgi:N-acetylmuramoyl-L-alanine amidase